MFTNRKYANVLLGDHHRALIRLYAKKHMGIDEGARIDTSAVLRRCLEIACAEFSAEEIQAEKEKE